MNTRLNWRLLGPSKQRWKIPSFILSTIVNSSILKESYQMEMLQSYFKGIQVLQTQPSSACISLRKWCADALNHTQPISFDVL